MYIIYKIDVPVFACSISILLLLQTTKHYYRRTLLWAVERAFLATGKEKYLLVDTDPPLGRL